MLNERAEKATSLRRRRRRRHGFVLDDAVEARDGLDTRPRVDARRGAEFDWPRARRPTPATARGVSAVGTMADACAREVHGGGAEGATRRCCRGDAPDAVEGDRESSLKSKNRSSSRSARTPGGGAGGTGAPRLWRGAWRWQENAPSAQIRSLAVRDAFTLESDRLRTQLETRSWRELQRERRGERCSRGRLLRGLTQQASAMETGGGALDLADLRELAEAGRARVDVVLLTLAEVSAEAERAGGHPTGSRAAAGGDEPAAGPPRSTTSSRRKNATAMTRGGSARRRRAPRGPTEGGGSGGCRGGPGMRRGGDGERRRRAAARRSSPPGRRRARSGGRRRPSLPVDARGSTDTRAALDARARRRAALR